MTRHLSIVLLPGAETTRAGDAFVGRETQARTTNPHQQQSRVGNAQDEREEEDGQG